MSLRFPLFIGIESSKINDNLICPTSSRNIENFNFFSLPCSTHSDCIQYAGINKRCCKSAGIVNRCIDGVPKRIPKSPHFCKYSFINIFGLKKI